MCHSKSIGIISFLLILNLLPSFSQTPAESDSASTKAKKEKSLPLITTRTMKFTTNEGTWMSLDLTPDGKTILFELLGDLYTLPIEGGTATRPSAHCRRRLHDEHESTQRPG